MLPSVRADASIRTLQEAGTSILEQGAVLASGFLGPDVLAALRAECMRGVQQVLTRQVPARIMTLGIRRLHITLPLSGAFLRPDFLAHPFFDSLCRQLLGNDCIAGTLAVAISFPGAGTHHAHRDQPLLYGDDALDGALPPASLCLALPLVPITPDCGATALVPGSHRDPGLLKRMQQGERPAFVEPALAPGDAMIWDNRLVHWGLPNRGPVPRPLLLLYVQRAWFRNLNLATPASTLQIRPGDLDALPAGVRARFAWRYEPVRQEPITTAPVTRLTNCPCGSGERFKNCCGAWLE